MQLTTLNNKFVVIFEDVDFTTDEQIRPHIKHLLEIKEINAVIIPEDKDMEKNSVYYPFYEQFLLDDKIEKILI